MVRVIKSNDAIKCEVCNTDSRFTLKSITDKDNKEHHIDLYSDGTLMEHVYLDGRMHSGSLMGQLKKCPHCGRIF